MIRDPIETETTWEPELPGDGAGAATFAPPENAVGAPAIADGAIPTSQIVQ